MPYVPHLRYVIGGGLGSDLPHPEEWSCSVNIGRADGAHHAIDPDMAQAAWEAWNTNIAPISFVGAAVSLEYAKVSAIDATGHVIGTVFRYDQHSQSGGTSNLLPFTSCMAVSLRTGLRGPSHRGRFFIPTTNIPTDYHNGLVSAENVETLLAGALGFLNDLAGFGGGTSDTAIVASSKGYNTPVNEVAMGRVVDTQRRRRRSLPEEYVVAA